MGDKRACAGTSRNALQYGSLHLGVSGLVQTATQGAYDLGALQESFLDTLVHYEVHVALAKTKFWVREGIKYIAFRVGFHNRKRAQALGKHCQLGTMDADFASLGAEDIALHADKVAEIKEFLEYRVVHCRIFGIGAKCIASDVHLYSPLAVHQFHKTCLAHYASAHHAACNAYHAAVFRCGRSGDFFSLLVFHHGQIHKLGFYVG